MKKILLLLLPVLLFVMTGCEKENPDNARAKSIVGTYTCTRKGEVNIERSPSYITTPIDYTCEASISYLGENRVQLDMGGVIFTGYAFSNNELTFDTYTVSSSSDLLNVTYNIDMKGNIGAKDISIYETYSGSATGPNVDYPVSGHARTELKKK